MDGEMMTEWFDNPKRQNDDVEQLIAEFVDAFDDIYKSSPYYAGDLKISERVTMKDMLRAFTEEVVRRYGR